MRSKLVIALLIIMSITVCLGCGTSASRLSESPANDTSRIAVIMPKKNDPHWQKIASAMQKKATGHAIDVQFMGPSEIHLEEQKKYLEIAIAARVDGIITHVLDPEEFSSCIKKASIAGIPVVTVDSDASLSVRSVYVGTSNINAGMLAGETLARATAYHATIGIIAPIHTQTGYMDRMDGFRRIISKYADMEIATVDYTNGDRLAVIRAIENMLKKKPEINAFFCVSPSDLEGVAYVIDNRSNRSSYKLVGFDISDAIEEFIKNETIYATVVQDSEQMGTKSIELLIELMQGEISVDEKVHVGYTLVDKSNINNYQSILKDLR